MKPEFENIPLVKNESKKRFEIEVNGAVAFINYGELGHHLALVHTEVDPSHAGKGVGSALVEKTLHWIDQHHLTMMPFCPFIYDFVKRHPEWNRIVDSKFKDYAAL